MSHTYRIVRLFENGGSFILRSGVTLMQAKRHCNDPETSSETATTDFARAYTRKHGRWFDGYAKED